MNNWDLAGAKCSVPEEKDDKTKNEGGEAVWFRSIQENRNVNYYRQLIYTYYKQIHNFQKQLVKRSSNEFKKRLLTSMRELSLRKFTYKKDERIEEEQ